MITICDTGPIVAYLSRNDPYHAWAVALMKQVQPPLLVCEPVTTEVAYFLRDDGLSVDPLFQLLEREAIRLEFDISRHWPRMRTLMSRYKQMDLRGRGGRRDERAACAMSGANRRSHGFQRLSPE